MKWLEELGYRGVSLREALSIRGNSSGVRFAALTFDDGFHDFLTSAWPILQSYKFTATVYLPTSFISRMRKSCMGRACLTWREVRDLSKSCVEFGSHTVTHPKLYGMAWDQIRKELTESKLQIAHETQNPVSSFAYPFAFPQEDTAFTQRFVEAVRDCQYQNCVTTVIGTARTADNPLLLRRLPMNDCDDRQLFTAKLLGAYDWMARPQWVVRQAKRLFRSWGD
jgi:peptidoglycan/xylan/chitin deacetylase (PgdA/CDA1 family)